MSCLIALLRLPLQILNLILSRLSLKVILKFLHSITPITSVLLVNDALANSGSGRDTLVGSKQFI